MYICAREGVGVLGVQSERYCMRFNFHVVFEG